MLLVRHLSASAVASSSALLLLAVRWPKLFLGWSGVRFLVGFGFGHVNFLPFRLRSGFSRRAASGCWMGVGHVFLGLDVVGLFFVGVHLHSVGFVHSFCFGCSLLGSVLCCLVC
ncbi:hypothetical protein XENOCAPTIV_023719 [Xenoophorus captivus]|uniref:Uncharacterized protein n=1 Tax=Xenoophorus captivus TaxID=1517983 RepID=A0ABV0QT87_9TELE